MRAAGLKPGTPRARRFLEARETRRLRRLVARLQGCLGTLAPRARRLLALRAGLHGPARSAKATARIMHLSQRRERILERHALTELTRTAMTGCAGQPTQVVSAVAAATLPSLSASPPSTVVPVSGPSAQLSAVHASSSRHGGTPGSLSVARSRVRTEQAGTGGGTFPSAVVTALLGLLLAVAMVVVPKLRRYSAAPAAAGAAIGAGAAARRNNRRDIESAASAAPASAPSAEAPPADRPIRSLVRPTDPTIAPMAANAYSSMASDEGGPESQDAADEADGSEGSS